MSRQGRALSALVLGGVCIGCSPILVRLSEIGPIATAWWRLSLALAPLLLLLGRARGAGGGGTRPRGLAEHITAALPGVWLAADLVTWQISLHMTSVANSTLLVNMAPIFVTLGGWLLLRQSVSRAFLIGLAISIAGGVVLEGGPGAFGRGHLRGDAVAIGAAVFYAGYILLLGHARQRFSTTSIMLWSTVSAALITLPLAIVLEPTLTPATLSGWAVVVGLAWISHTGGQGLIAFSLAWLPVTMSSLTLLIQPVVAAVLAWAVLGEHLGAFQMIGGCIVIAGIVLARHG